MDALLALLLDAQKTTTKPCGLNVQLVARTRGSESGGPRMFALHYNVPFPPEN